ncbi:MAG: TetR/AcrR family transcriptional regulator [Oscillospiraceae bacterium]
MSDHDTKNKIIKTMYELVAEKGYDKASIGQIAEVIGIKKASVYYYFRSKEDIFLNLVKDLYSSNFFDKSTIFDKDCTMLNYKQELIKIGETFISSYFENKDMRKVYAEVDLQTTRIPALKEFIDTTDKTFNEFLKNCMEQGVTLGVFRADFNVSINAQILYAVLIGIDQAILYDLPIDPNAVWNEIIAKLFNENE